MRCSWSVNQQEIDRYRAKKERCDNKLLTHPVPEYVRNMFGKKTPKHSGATMVFKRYPALSVPEYELDVLVKAFLGFPHPMGYKEERNNVILNEAWTINLRSTEKENIMMDAFLKGFNGKHEQLKKAWEESIKTGLGTMEIDVSEEMKLEDSNRCPNCGEEDEGDQDE